MGRHMTAASFGTLRRSGVAGASVSTISPSSIRRMCRNGLRVRAFFLNLAICPLTGFGLRRARCLRVGTDRRSDCRPCGSRAAPWLPLLGSVPKQESSTPKEALLDRSRASLTHISRCKPISASQPELAVLAHSQSLQPGQPKASRRPHLPSQPRCPCASQSYLGRR